MEQERAASPTFISSGFRYCDQYLLFVWMRKVTAVQVPRIMLCWKSGRHSVLLGAEMLTQFCGNTMK